MLRILFRLKSITVEEGHLPTDGQQANILLVPVHPHEDNMHPNASIFQDKPDGLLKLRGLDAKLVEVMIPGREYFIDILEKNVASVPIDGAPPTDGIPQPQLPFAETPGRGGHKTADSKLPKAGTGLPNK